MSQGGFLGRALSLRKTWNKSAREEVLSYSESGGDEYGEGVIREDRPKGRKGERKKKQNYVKKRERKVQRWKGRGAYRNKGIKGEGDERRKQRTRKTRTRRKLRTSGLNSN